MLELSSFKGEFQYVGLKWYDEMPFRTCAECGEAFKLCGWQYMGANHCSEKCRWDWDVKRTKK